MPRRATRAATARNYQSRSADMREMITQEAQGVLWFDPKWQPPGMTYGWIRRAVNNEEDAYTIRTRQQSGWKPIPADRHPQMSVQGWGLPSETQKNYVEIAGLIWCEIPTRLLERHKAAQKMMAFEATKMPHIEDLGDQAVSKELPMFDESQTAFERVTTERVKQAFKE